MITGPAPRSAPRRLLVAGLCTLILFTSAGTLHAGLPTNVATTDETTPSTSSPPGTGVPSTTAAPTTTGPTTSTTAETTTTSTQPTSTAVPSSTTSTTVAPATTAVPTSSSTIAPTTATTSTTVAPAPSADAPQLVATAAVPAPTCTVSMTVRLGTRGTPAICVETRLVQLGYWLSGPNSHFDPTAVTALRNFQIKHGLDTTGVANRVTLQRLEIWAEPRPLPPPTCQVFMTVSLGTRGDPALCVETRLVQLGYWLAGPNDNFDSTAVIALRNFQTKFGLADDGVAGKATLLALGIWTEPRPLPAASCGTSWPVVVGSVGFPARCVETRLAQLGYWLVGPDDQFDSTSANALIAFQRKYGLQATGWADFHTLLRLGIWRTLVQPAATCRTHHPVSLGSTGSGARCVQTRLVQLGYWLRGPDDYFDSTAVTALRNFQYKHGLVGDGIAGSRTLMRLGIYDPNPPPATALPDNSGTGRRIVYSRAQQRIWAVDANGVVVKTHRVSGRLYEPYRGTYYVYSRSLYTNSATDPSVRWRYMVRFAYGPQGGRIGFHEIPNRYGVPLQSHEQIGLPLSGGCVRQTTADALWVWNWAGLGTKVVVL